MSHKGIWRYQLSTPLPTKPQHTKAACGISDPGLLQSSDFQRSSSSCTHLWSNIVWCATESRRGDSITDPLFAHSEVRQFTVTLVVQQYIVQFQVSEKNKLQHVVGQPGPKPFTWTSWLTGWVIGPQSGHAHVLQKEQTSLNFLDKKFRSNLKICLMVPRCWLRMNGLTTRKSRLSFRNWMWLFQPSHFPCICKTSTQLHFPHL